jgi:hypothetical protein
MGLRIEMGLSSYPVWLWEALDDGEEEPGIPFGVIRETDAQGVNEHLVQTLCQEGLWQFPQVVFQHA